MKKTIRKFAAAVGMGLIATLLAATAFAGCGTAKLQRQSWDGTVNPASLFLVSDTPDPIVGMWHTLFIVGTGSSAQVIDNTFVQIHSDGTEIMNSSRPPDTGNFCVGAWEKVGPGEYRINHFGIGWVSGDDSAPLGFAHIQEHIVISSDGKSYKGSFIIDQFNQAKTNIAHLAGQLSAKRITATTPITSVY